MFFLYAALLLAITTFIIVVSTSQLNWKACLCRMFNAEVKLFNL